MNEKLLEQVRALFARFGWWAALIVIIALLAAAWLVGVDINTLLGGG